MKRFQTLVAISLLAVTLAASGCGPINSVRAKSHVNDGARAYKAGKFKDAQAEFEEAIRLDPNQDNAPIFRARSIERQYRQGLDTPENQAKAQAAIQAYQEILQKAPNGANSDEAYNSIVRLYGALKQEDKQREYVTARASRQDTPSEKRAIDYAFLAGKQWRCSYDITELETSKQTVTKGDKTVIEYKKPAEQSDFDKARQCATEGLSLANQSVQFDPNSEAAWAVKSNLLLEMSKLAQMEGKAEDKANFDQQYKEAIAKNTELHDINQRQKEEREAAEKAKKEKKT